jgi:DNA repair protein RecO (recombination protein O)
MLTKDQAVCIRAVDYSETSQVVTFFTRTTGKISVIAKGSKRPKSPVGGPIELFSTGKIVFSATTDQKLSTLTEFEQQDNFGGLARNISVMNSCLFAVELLDNLTKDYDPHPQLFDSFLQFLQNISEMQGQPVTTSLLILFQLTLLKEVGLQPVLNHCVNCKTQYAPRNTQSELYFSSGANGLICRDCESAFADKIRLSSNAATCLSNLKLLADADEKVLNEIEKVLISHFTALLGRRPKMAKHVLKP